MKRINGVPCFRIINKSKSGVLLETPMSEEKQSKMSWAEFNQNFDIIGNVWCSVKKDSKVSRTTAWISDRVRNNPFLMIMLLHPNNENAFQAGYGLIEICEDFRKEFGEDHTDADIINLVKTCIETLKFTMGNPLRGARG
jgi:hypothetical protein